MKNESRKNGFTLAELLIVVAIIAVLTAIAIPVFTSQLEKSREAVDISNIRSYYAEITTALITGDLREESGGSTIVYVGNNLEASLDDPIPTEPGKSFEVVVEDITIQQNQTNWQTAEFEIAGLKGGANVTSPEVLNWTSTIGSPCNVAYTFQLAADGDYVLRQIQFG